MRDCDPRLELERIRLDEPGLKLLTKRLTDLLHDVDPMGTCCTVNLDMEDEYECEAFHIAALMVQGVPLRDAIHDVFDLWFWEGRLEERWDRLGLDEWMRWVADRLDDSPRLDDMPALHRELCLGILPALPGERGRWSYARFMRAAPVVLDPDADLIDIGRVAPNAFFIDLEDDEQDARMPGWCLPRPGAPDPANVLPWLHRLLFEKARRRTPPEHRVPWERLRAQVLTALAATEGTPG